MIFKFKEKSFRIVLLKPKIKIFYKIFEQEDQAKIRMILQENTVVRKEKPLTQEEFERLKLDLEARKLEDNKGSEQKFKKLQEQLIHTKTENLENIVLKTPRVGTEGCCGKGCNGCLMFWHDEKYSKARALLKQKKMGQMLTTAEANIAS